MSLSCRVSAISAFCWPTTQTPSITNSPVAMVHTKPVIAILVPKNWLQWQCSLESRNRLCLHRLAWPRKPTTRIKQSVASYYATKVIAQRNPKIGCKATSLSTSGPPSTTRCLGPIRANYPNSISIGSTAFAQMTVEYPYTLQWDAHSPPKNCPFPQADLDPI